MTTRSNLRQRIETTTRAFLSAFEEGSTHQDPSIINRDVTKDCSRLMCPASIPEAFGLPKDFLFDTESFQAAFANDIKVLRFENIKILDLVIDTEACSAAFRSSFEVSRIDGESFDYEQSWFLDFAADGLKVQKVVEFCDKDGILKMAKASGALKD